MVVHREGIADWHDQRRRFALRGADRTKQEIVDRAVLSRKDAGGPSFLIEYACNTTKSLGL
jgi:hypothetical protein